MHLEEKCCAIRIVALKGLEDLSVLHRGLPPPLAAREGQHLRLLEDLVELVVDVYEYPVSGTDHDRPMKLEIECTTRHEIRRVQARLVPGVQLLKIGELFVIDI